MFTSGMSMCRLATSKKKKKGYKLEKVQTVDQFDGDHLLWVSQF